MDKPMSMASDEKEVQILRAELQQLRQLCEEKEQRLLKLEPQNEKYLPSVLNNDDIARYSRQLILPNFGVQGQLKLKETSFLVVGMGGLGCPSSQYLLAAGCGQLGLVDYDVVERNNFHRQTLYSETEVGMPKVEAAKKVLSKINPNCKISCYRLLLNSENALDIIDKHDVILDCSDNVATRYLLNDACVMLKKPLISGSALQMDGQLTVYNYGGTGPCYRCLFPIPPPPETVTNCGDGGVLGAVTGTIGSLQALEGIKVALGGIGGEVLAGRLLIFDGANCSFRNIRLRSKRKDCDVCSPNPIITKLIDYEMFCGMQASDKNVSLKVLSPEQRLSVEHYHTNLQSKTHLLLDVRQTSEFDICKLPNSYSVPLKSILDDTFLMKFAKDFENKEMPIVLLCRRGNDSQLAVRHLLQKFPDKSNIFDLKGGLHAWHFKIDKSFPIY